MPCSSLPDRSELNLSFESLTSDTTLRLLRTIQTSDPELWSAIHLRKNDEAVELGGNNGPELTGGEGNNTVEFQSQLQREQSGTNDLDQQCAEDDSAVPMAALITPPCHTDSNGLKLPDTVGVKMAAGNTDSEQLKQVIETDDGILVLAGIAEEVVADNGEIKNDTDIFVPVVSMGDASNGDDSEPRRSKRTKTATS